MTRWLGMLIFISIFVGICFGGYYYILSRLFAFFKLKHNLYFWLALAVLAFGYVGFSFLDRRFPCGVCNFFVRLSAIGLGVGWLCLVVLLSHDVLYLVLRFPVSLSRWAAVGTILLLTGYAFINALRSAAWRSLPGYDEAEWGAPKGHGVKQLANVT